LGEYGATVLKITSSNLSDVPFFQVDGNMGKHAADLDIKSPAGKVRFESLLTDVDIVVDGYRPGTFDRLGYGPKALAEMAAKRGKGIVYINENCFGYEGEWAHRPGWQQIADCVSAHWLPRMKAKANKCQRSLAWPGSRDDSWGCRSRWYHHFPSQIMALAAWELLQL
jgi:hypothetical protein